MRITLTNVIVDDQAEALAFYTEVLGFQKHHDEPVGEYSWLTVVSPEQPDGPELLLEPAAHPAARTYRDALTADGIPSAQFTVDGPARHRHVGDRMAFPPHRPAQSPPLLVRDLLVRDQPVAPLRQVDEAADAGPEAWMKRSIKQNRRK